MLAKIEEFLSTPAGRFLGMAGLAILTAVLTYIAAQTVNRLWRKLVDRQKKSGSSLATVTGFVRYIAVAAVYFAVSSVLSATFAAESVSVPLVSRLRLSVSAVVASSARRVSTVSPFLLTAVG